MNSFIPIDVFPRHFETKVCASLEISSGLSFVDFIVRIASDNVPVLQILEKLSELSEFEEIPEFSPL